MKAYLGEILDLLGESRRRLPGLVLLFMGSSVLDFVGIGLVGPYVALVVDPQALQGPLGELLAPLGVPRGQHAALIVLGFVLLAVFVLKAIAAIGIQGRIIRFSNEQQTRLRSELMHSYQHLPYTEFLRRNSSEYVYAIESLTNDFANLLQVALRTVSDAIVTLVVVCLLVWQNAPALALLLGLLAAMVYGYDRIARRNLRSYGERVNEAGTMLVQGIHEGIEGLKEIRILGCEGYFHGMVDRGSRDYARFSGRSQLIAATPRQLVELAMVTFVVTLVFLVLLFGGDATALVPTLGTFGVAALRLTPAASTFSASLIQLRFGRDSVSQLHRDVSALARVRLEASQPHASDAEPFGSLVVDQVTFTYPDATVAALDGLYMKIGANESVGLVGLSGSGKTTLVDILLGLLEPQQGKLRYNGRLLKEALGEWRAQVAYLPQQVFLIDNTLRHNVALGLEDGEIDETRLLEALRQARLSELVAQLPQGVHTRVGERGVRLSGGQRQRVALARAFYHGRDVLVMDEATSALDDETEQEIVEEIRQLKGQKTLIVIAHRPSTVRHCDRIYRLSGGRIVQHGTPAEMLPDA